MRLHEHCCGTHAAIKKAGPRPVYKRRIYRQQRGVERSDCAGRRGVRQGRERGLERAEEEVLAERGCSFFQPPRPPAVYSPNPSPSPASLRAQIPRDLCSSGLAFSGGWPWKPGHTPPRRRPPARPVAWSWVRGRRRGGCVTEQVTRGWRCRESCTSVWHQWAWRRDLAGEVLGRGGAGGGDSGRLRCRCRPVIRSKVRKSSNSRREQTVGSNSTSHGFKIGAQPPQAGPRRLCPSAAAVEDRILKILFTADFTSCTTPFFSSPGCAASLAPAHVAARR